MNNIDKFAIVSPEAKLGDNVTVEPFAVIEGKVTIGDGCHIQSHAVIRDYTTIGKDCKVFPGAVVGAIPQDLKFDGEVSYVVIGDRTTIRECATINRGTTGGGGTTRIGSDTLIMSYAHIAHDCQIGDHCVIVSRVSLAGHVEIGDWAVIGGTTGVHQFVHIGTHAMIGAMRKVTMDAPPYATCEGEPLRFAGINLTGLRRRGFTHEQIDTIKEIFNTLYNRNLLLKDAVKEIEDNFPPSVEKDNILAFIAHGTRGLIRPGK